MDFVKCSKCGNKREQYGVYRCGHCRRQYLREWTEKNRTYVNQKSREQRAKDPERRREIVRLSAEKNREKRLEYKRAHYQENKEKYVEWAKRCDPDSRKAIKYRYRARKKMNGIEKYSPADIFARDNHKCVYCEKPAKELDHLIPIFRGGADSPTNVAASCMSCNRRKRTKTATEFMLPKFLKVVEQLRRL